MQVHNQCWPHPPVQILPLRHSARSLQLWSPSCRVPPQLLVCSLRPQHPLLLWSQPHLPSCNLWSLHPVRKPLTLTSTSASVAQLPIASFSHGSGIVDLGNFLSDDPSVFSRICSVIPPPQVWTLALEATPLTDSYKDITSYTLRVAN